MDAYVLRPLKKEEIGLWYAACLQADFPSQEIKPLEDISARLAAGRYALLGLFPASKDTAHVLLGYAGLMQAPDLELLLLDYLAVSETLRNQGLGSHILALLAAQYPGRPMVTEAELPIPGENRENNLRTRRLAFYQRAGFVPVYETAACGMRWQALLRMPAEGETPIYRIMEAHRALYGPGRQDVVIPFEGVVPHTGFPKKKIKPCAVPK